MLLVLKGEGISVKVFSLAVEQRSAVLHLVLLVGLVVLVDQVTKILAITFCEWSDTYLHKSGFSFLGIPLEAPIRLVGVSIVGVLAYCARIPRIPTSLIIGGGIGNLIDFLTYRGVIDWIGIAGTYTNLADVCMLVGSLILVGKYFKTPSIRIESPPQKIAVILGFSLLLLGVFAFGTWSSAALKKDYGIPFPCVHASAQSYPLRVRNLSQYQPSNPRLAPRHKSVLFFCRMDLSRCVRRPTSNIYAKLQVYAYA